MGFETKTGSPSKGLLLFPSALRSALCLFVNMRQKHVIPVTPFGSTSNQKTGVCAGGRGLFVLLWKMSMDEGAGCRSGTALDLVITREHGGGRRWQPWRSSICKGNRTCCDRRAVGKSSPPPPPPPTEPVYIQVPAPVNNTPSCVWL